MFVNVEKDIIWALSGGFTKPSTTLPPFFVFDIFIKVMKRSGEKERKKGHRSVLVLLHAFM